MDCFMYSYLVKLEIAIQERVVAGGDQHDHTQRQKRNATYGSNHLCASLDGQAALLKLLLKHLQNREAYHERENE